MNIRDYKDVVPKLIFISLVSLAGIGGTCFGGSPGPIVLSTTATCPEGDLITEVKRAQLTDEAIGGGFRIMLEVEVCIKCKSPTGGDPTPLNGVKIQGSIPALQGNEEVPARLTQTFDFPATNSMDTGCSTFKLNLTGVMIVNDLEDLLDGEEFTVQVKDINGKVVDEQTIEIESLIDNE